MSCPRPIQIKNDKQVSVDDYAYHLVPCGKCYDCKKDKAAQWAFRILQEEKRHKLAAFVTLTYDEKNVPMLDNGLATLNKDHWQKFIKRLRKNTGIKSIKYYACGEYGGRTKRPHYHAIMFDVPEKAVEKAWQKGNIDYGNVTPASIRYVTNYLVKSRMAAEQLKGREPEFSLMSKKLGENYLTPEMIKWHKTELRNYAVSPNGTKISLPRYYREKIFNETEQWNIKSQNTIYELQRPDKLIRQYGSLENFEKNDRAIAYYKDLKMINHKTERNKL
jgi:hypothetical protein